MEKGEVKKEKVSYENNLQLIPLAKEGNTEALNKLIEANLPLVTSISKKFTNRGYEYEDIYQIGCMGLVKAIKNFDEKYNVKFSTYAVPYILGEIKKFIRDDGIIKISRSTKELGIKIKNIEKRYMQEKGESISIKKLSEILKVTEVEIVSAIEASRQVESINEEAYEEGNCTKIEKIANNYDEQGRLIDKLTLNQMIDDLKERDKKVIKLRFYQEKTQSQVAKLLGISQVQVSRIEKKILRELKEKIIQENVS